MGIREEHRARMLREIQRAALDLVEANGVEATTVAEIAARVGISERTVFRYYPTKLDALLPGQQGLIDALVAVGGNGAEPGEIFADLLAVVRAEFALEVERHDFRRISRLLTREPDLVHAVSQQERSLVAALTAALAANGALRHLQALLLAEVVTATWRVTWQAFAREESEGRECDPLALFDDTVRELGGLFSS